VDKEERAIVTFTSELFDLSWPPGRDPNYPPLGYDAAVYFQRKLSERGIPSIDDEPIMGEGGWHWRVSSGQEVLSLVLNWAPIGSPPRDCWVIQSQVHTGYISRLIGRKNRDYELVPLCTVLKIIIESEPGITDVHWLTTDEFRKIYERCRGVLVQGGLTTDESRRHRGRQRLAGRHDLNKRLGLGQPQLLGDQNPGCARIEPAQWHRLRLRQ
jgi:hypothetical protein